MSLFDRVVGESVGGGPSRRHQMDPKKVSGFTGSGAMEGTYQSKRDRPNKAAQMHRAKSKADLTRGMLAMSENALMSIWGWKMALSEAGEAGAVADMPAEHKAAFAHLSRINKHLGAHNAALNRAAEYKPDDKRLRAGAPQFSANEWETIQKHHGEPAKHLKAAADLIDKDPSRAESTVKHLESMGHLGADLPTVHHSITAKERENPIRHGARFKPEDPTKPAAPLPASKPQAAKKAEEPAKAPKLAPAGEKSEPSKPTASDKEKSIAGQAQALMREHSKAHPEHKGDVKHFEGWLKTHWGSEGAPVHVGLKSQVMRHLRQHGAPNFSY